LKTYHYKGFDRDGRSRRGLVEALGVKDARERLAKTGVFAEKIEAVGGMARTVPGTAGNVGLTDERRIMAYRELGALVKAGLPMVRAIEVLIDSPEIGDARGRLAAVKDAVREGASLEDALGGASAKVGPFEKAMIAAGERAGTLGDVLEKLSSFMEEQQSLKERVRTAMIYPLIVVSVAVIVAVGVFVFVLPQTGKFLHEMRLPVPLVTRIMMSVGNIVAICGVPVVALVVLAVAYFRRRLRTSESVRLKFDRRLFSAPIIGRGYSLLANLRFARTFSMLLRGGVAAVDAIILSGRATGSVWITSLSESAAETVRHGGSLADAVRVMPPLASTLPAWIQAGEAGGNVENLLDNAAERYQRQWERFVTRSLGLLEPAIILALGVFVLVVALSVLLPIIAGNQALQAQ